MRVHRCPAGAPCDSARRRSLIVRCCEASAGTPRRVSRSAHRPRRSWYGALESRIGEREGLRWAAGRADAVGGSPSGAPCWHAVISRSRPVESRRPASAARRASVGTRSSLAADQRPCAVSRRVGFGAGPLRVSGAPIATRRKLTVLDHEAAARRSKIVTRRAAIATRRRWIATRDHETTHGATDAGAVTAPGAIVCSCHTTSRSRR